MDISTELIPSYSWIRLYLLLTASFIAIVICKNISSNKLKNRKRKLYYGTVLLIFITLLIRYPLLTFQAEPIWETGSNFFLQTFYRGFKDSIFLDDAGYWPLFQRLLSQVIILLFQQQKHAILLLQLLCTAFAAYVCGRFVKNEFNEYFNTNIRFVIAIFLGSSCFLNWSNILILNNIGYASGIYILFNFMLDMKELKKWKYVSICIITILVSCSKIYYIGLIPIILLVYIWRRQYLCNRIKRYMLVSLIGPFLQLIYCMMNVGEAGIGNFFRPIFESLTNSIYYYIQSYLYFIKDYNVNGYFSGFFYNVIIIICIISSIVFLLKKCTDKKVVLCISLLFWGIGVSFINSYSGGNPKIITVFSFLSATSGTNGFHDFLIHLSNLFFIIILCSIISKKICNRLFFNNMVAVVLLLLCVRFSFQSQHGMVNTYHFTNWSSYASECLAKESYGIPTSAFDSFLLKNAAAIYIGDRDINVQNGHFMTGVNEKYILDGQSEKVSEINLDNKMGKEKRIVSLYTMKSKVSQPDDIYMLLIDETGNIIRKVKGRSEYDRTSIAFILEEPIQNVSKITFVHDNNVPYELKPEFFIVYEELGTGLKGNAVWG